MYILFKRHGNRRFFKRYNSFEELNHEIRRGHNERFPGNNQFYYHIETREIEILNSRMSIFTCQEYLETSNVVPSEMSIKKPCMKQSLTKPTKNFDHAYRLSSEQVYYE